MSTFVRSSRHPLTTEWDDSALWIDDYFGNHNYGVKFSDGEVYDPREFEIETRNVPTVSVSLENEAPERVDVVVQVNAINVTEDDEATRKAKEVIEKEVIAKLADRDVMVAVVYRHPIDAEYMFAKKVVKLPNVRKYAESCVESFIKNVKKDADPQDFLVVEHYKDTDEVKITKL